MSTAVWEHAKAKGSNLLVLLALADCAHDDGTNAYPSIESLVKKTRLSTRSVQGILRELEAAGEIRRDPCAGPRGVNVYTITLPGLLRGAKSAPPVRAKGCNSPHPAADSGGADQRTEGCSPASSGVQPVAPKPLRTVKEPSDTPLPPSSSGNGPADERAGEGVNYVETLNGRFTIIAAGWTEIHHDLSASWLRDALSEAAIRAGPLDQDRLVSGLKTAAKRVHDRLAADNPRFPINNPRGLAKSRIVEALEEVAHAPP